MHSEDEKEKSEEGKVSVDGVGTISRWPRPHRLFEWNSNDPWAMPMPLAFFLVAVQTITLTFGFAKI